MCLIALARTVHGRWPLVIAANRDEFHERPTCAAHFWEDAPHVIGGRDLRAGGSWLAVARGGRFAAVTNIRGEGRSGGPSRGGLVVEFVKGDENAGAFVKRVKAKAHDYAGFHLIVGDGSNLAHVTSSGEASAITPGIFAITNTPFGVEWPKARLAREAMGHAIEVAQDEDELADQLMTFLSTKRGTPIEEEIFVEVPERGYGTRSSTVIIVKRNGDVMFRERNWPGGETISQIIRAT